jgi:hypothetical protein
LFIADSTLERKARETMSYSHHSSGSLESGMFSLLLVCFTILLVLALIGLYLLCRACMLVGRVFFKHPGQRSLWLSLGIFCLLLVAGLSLAAVSATPAGWILPGSGAAQLLLTCKVVEINKAQLFIPEETKIVQKVLHTSWWADYHH